MIDIANREDKTDDEIRSILINSIIRNRLNKNPANKPEELMRSRLRRHSTYTLELIAHKWEFIV